MKLIESISALWERQAAQQRDLGLDPQSLSEVERRQLANELLLFLFEESADLSRAFGTYKRHLMKLRPVDRAAVAEEMADVMKTMTALGQLYGVTAEEFCHAFQRKTAVVQRKADMERLELTAKTKLLCVDLDDVLCDLAPFREQLLGSEVDTPPPDKLAIAEALKEEFYKGGRFRDMKPVARAAESMRELKDAGWTIAIITARPQWQYKRLYADTVFWLERYDIPHDLLLFNKDKVEALYEHVLPAWPRAFVEDHERNARALAGVGVRVLLFDQPHNREVFGENIARVHGWGDVLDELRSLQKC